VIGTNAGVAETSWNAATVWTYVAAAIAVLVVVNLLVVLLLVRRSHED
jgi:hypothetical protein